MKYNRQFFINTSEKEFITKYLLPATKDDHQYFWTATDVLLHLSNLTENKLKLSPANIGKALKLCGFERIKQNPEKIFGYYVKTK